MRKKNSSGYTLVELAMVLIIIGLLIGSIIAAIGMVDAYRVRGTIADLEQLQTLVKTFEAKYSCLPGDCDRAVAILGSIGAQSIMNGDGNGIISDSSQGAVTNEPQQSFRHLARAQMLTSYNPWLADWALPTRITGCHLYPFGNSNLYGQTAIRYNTIRVTRRVNGPPWQTACLTPERALDIDTKMDDGSADTGDVLGQHVTSDGDWTECLTGTKSPFSGTWGAGDKVQYDLSKTQPRCSLSITIR